MIELQFDRREIDRALRLLDGSQFKLSRAVKLALRRAVPGVRQAVIGTLEQNVIVGHRFIRRAVRAVRFDAESGRFNVFSKNLFLDDYELTPREQTARQGMRSKQWPGFSYRLRRGGKTFHSLGTLTGTDGTGGTPFLAPTQSGNLRVMYRRSADRATPGKDVFLMYAPSIQYHAAAPEVEELARITSMKLFHAGLDEAVSALLSGRAS